MNPDREDLTPIDEALRAASQSMAARAIKGRIVEAAWAARAAYHSCVVQQEGITDMPPGIAIHIAQMAFGVVWNASEQG